MESMCRLCAQMKPPTQLTYSIDDPMLNIVQKLIDCCRWTLFENYDNFDNLPQRICDMCYENLEQSWSFAESVAAAQQTLLSYAIEVKPTIFSADQDRLIAKDEPIEESPDIMIDASELNCPFSNYEYAFPSIVPVQPESSFINVKQPKPQPTITANSISFLCDTCGKKLSTYSNLMTHRLIHLPSDQRRSFECYVCKTTFRYKKSIIHHMSVHSGIKIQYQCNVCLSSFSRSDALRRHTLIHLKLQPHLCSTCGKGFRTKFNLKVKSMNVVGNLDLIVMSIFISDTRADAYGRKAIRMFVL